jgi:ribosomal protein S18 acetylase RimI-like enzyme
MFETKEMAKEDFDFAVRITERMGWHLGVDDFEFAVELEPQGCFTLFWDLKRVGLATTISYDRIGWFGNLVVEEAYRRKGAGSSLVEHSIAYLKSRGVETVALYAYMDKIRFYERLGFEHDSDFVVLKGRAFPSPAQANVRKAREEDLTAIIEYDSHCFGGSRRKLLEPIILYPNNLCYVFAEAERISGYVVAKVYDGMAELGPLVCPRGRSDIADGLIRAVFDRLKGLEVSVFVPEKESSIVNVLKKAGFKEGFRVARMFQGPPLPEQCICLAESLERG